MTDADDTIFDEEWRDRSARIKERLRRTDEIQHKWRENPMHPATLIDVSKALCDSEASKAFA